MTYSDVHTRHCCKYHGCKYGDYDCSVAYRGKLQEFECESCIEDRLSVKDTLKWMYDYFNRLENDSKLPDEYRPLYDELLKLKIIE